MDIVQRVNNSITDYYAKCVIIPKFLILDVVTYKRFARELNKREKQPDNKKVVRYKGMQVCILKEDAFDYVRCI